MPASKKTTKDEPVKASKPKKAAKTVAEKTEKTGGFAIIETGGKQYKVAVGDTIKVEKINGPKGKEMKEGEVVVFNKVLLIDNGVDTTDIGTPYVEGAKVAGTLVQIGRDPKVTVIKYKQKSRYFKKNGHRQPFFKVKIDQII